jgi:hypothetical protein
MPAPSGIGGPVNGFGQRRSRSGRPARRARIILMPSTFAGPPAARPALVVYQVGSAATLRDRTFPDAGVERLLGRTRAAVIRRVGTRRRPSPGTPGSASRPRPST